LEEIAAAARLLALVCTGRSEKMTLPRRRSLHRFFGADLEEQPDPSSHVVTVTLATVLDDRTIADESPGKASGRVVVFIGRSGPDWIQRVK
jgi:hypothetical protein